MPGHRHLESAAERGSIASSPLMSAPAMNVRPAPTTTSPLTDESRCAASTALERPSMTSGLSALTGGLSMVMTAIPSWILVETTLVIESRG
jgi:hypothetical protein